MDTTLAINPGSSSKKYALFRDGTCVFSALFEHTETGFGKCVEMNDERQRCEEMTAVAYERGLYEVIDQAVRAEVIGSVKDITRVAMRIVAPGSYFTVHREITSQYREALARMRDAAPLHIPHIESELDIAEEAIPHTPLYGISDSAFHTTMAPYAHIYSVPSGDAKQFDVYRFGYHGLSVASAVQEVQMLHGAVPKRMIVVHVGSGISITALSNGKSVDTTMGFGPTSGLIMGTRGGDLDPAALLYLQKKTNRTAAQMDDYINQESGLRGLIGSNDLRVALDRVARGDRDVCVAVDAYFYHIRKMIGAYIGVLEGLDALVFTGTAAERNPLVRARISAGFSHAGIELNREENERLSGRNGTLSPDGSPVSLYVVRAEEMREMARVVTTLV